VPCDALTEMTAARIGPAQGAKTKPSAPPTTIPDQKPSASFVGAKRDRPDIRSAIQ